MPEVQAPLPLRHVLVEGPHGPGCLPAGRLYLDDVRSHFSHLLATPLTFLISKLQHPQPSKGPRRVGVRRPCGRRSWIRHRLIPTPVYR